jgi:aspartate aminotransferase-like enzyme
MLENFTNKLLENVVSAYSSRVEDMAQTRGAELASVKSKIRVNPEEVEAWFDREIDKVKGIDINAILRNARL